MSRRRRSSNALRVRVYGVLSRAVEEGVRHGWYRAHKHNEKPDEFTVCEHVYTEIMNAICEVFAFDDDATAQA